MAAIEPTIATTIRSSTAENPNPWFGRKNTASGRASQVSQFLNANPHTVSKLQIQSIGREGRL